MTPVQLSRSVAAVRFSTPMASAGMAAAAMPVAHGSCQAPGASTAASVTPPTRLIRRHGNGAMTIAAIIVSSVATGNWPE